jgi:hypothetical protein
MSLMSDNEMRELCRTCLDVRHELHGVFIGLDVVKARRFIRSFGWHEPDAQRIINEALLFVSEIANATVAEAKAKLQSTEPISRIDPDCP